MSQTYSTGEVAKKVGVSVRTVQYYDQRGILNPSELTEGGRRIYSDKDLQTLQIICFLRELDFSIEQIRRVLSEENVNQILELLLQEHVEELRAEINLKRDQLSQVSHLLATVKSQQSQSLESLTGISIAMKHQTAWRRFQRKMWGTVLASLLVYILAVSYLSSLVNSNLKTAFGLVTGLVFAFLMVGLSYYGYRKVSYICPNCHKFFNPTYFAFVFAGHTPKTRKLTCPYCHHRSYCLETVVDDKKVAE